MRTNRPVPDSQSHTCHACRSGNLETVSDSTSFHRVTSDAKAWSPGSLIGRCRDCGLVQTAVTPEWLADIRRIYEGYTIYHQGGGTEQSVFRQQDGKGSPRSEALVEALKTRHKLPETGRLLDVGCGNGSILRAWGRTLPGWELQGTEFDEKYKAEVEAIPGVTAMHGGRLEDVPGTFDVVSMVHVLEHIPDPIPVLNGIQERLAPGGLLFVEVPDCLANPVMMLVADHCSHFATVSLAGLAADAGYVDVAVSDDWTPRELSLTARRDETGNAPDRSAGRHSASVAGSNAGGAMSDSSDEPDVLGGLDWLGACAVEAERLANEGEFGIFGASIAATWLESQIGNRASFFVDEDPARRGREHLGKPILAPADVEDGAVIYVALPHPLAGAVAERLNGMGKNFKAIAPPERS